MAEVSLRRKNADAWRTERSFLHVAARSSKPGGRPLDCTQQKRNRTARHSCSRFHRTLRKPRLHPAGELGRGSFGRTSQIWNASLDPLSPSQLSTLALTGVEHSERFRERAAASIVWGFETPLACHQFPCCCARRCVSGAHQLDLEEKTVALGWAVFFSSRRAGGAIVSSRR